MTLLKRVRIPVSDTPFPSTGQLVDVVFDKGILQSILPATDSDSGKAGFDAQGAWLLPAAFDIGVQLPHSPQSLKTTLQAALAGGVVNLVSQITKPSSLSEVDAVEMLTRRSRESGLASVFSLASLIAETEDGGRSKLGNLGALRHAGCVGFSSPPGTLLGNYESLYRAMQYAVTFDYTLWLHPVDIHLGSKGVAHRSPFNSDRGLAEVPTEAETIPLLVLLELARATGVRLHFCRLSCGRSVELLRQAKAEGLPVTADVAITHLLLSEGDTAYFNSAAKLSPPLRSAEDRLALTAGVRDGVIDAICSNHIGCHIDAKQKPYGEAIAGAATVEFFLPLAVKWAYQENIPFSRLIDAISCRPRAIALGLKSVSHQPFDIGAPADFCLFDEQLATNLEATELCSDYNNPFVNAPIGGLVSTTFIAGDIAYQRG